MIHAKNIITRGLHEEFFETAECYPEKTAIIWYDEMRENITYAQLADKFLEWLTC